MVKNALALALLSFVAACDGKLEPRTQLMLVADTDVPPPGTIAFEIMGPDGRMEPGNGPFASTEELPRTLALVHTEGPLGPFTVSASIEFSDGTTTPKQTITRTHTLSFVRGKTLLVPLHLARACLDECTGRACSETARCIETELDSATLAPYAGHPDRVFGLDGGTVPSDGGPAMPDAGATDSGVDGGVDSGVVTDMRTCGDQQVDVLSDKDHCGQCGTQCPTAPSGRRSSGAKCVAGKCALICDDGWGDCNEKPNNGCETNIMSNNRNHCGACAAPCPDNNICMAGKCSPN